MLQPGYLPWLGYFDLMRRADVFVAYDDVQFDKHGWRNRNRVKGRVGPLWLTVPVRHHNTGRPLMRDVEIDAGRGWARKHVATIRQCYARAAHLEPYTSELEALLDRSWSRLAVLDVEGAALIASWLGITTPVVRSSDLGVSGDRNERLVAICNRFGADCYLSGNAARDYLDERFFAASDITVEWQNLAHPVYPQQHGSFISHLSTVDVILNCGADRARALLEAAAPRRAVRGASSSPAAPASSAATSSATYTSVTPTTT